jgi:hypothetical protein
LKTSGGRTRRPRRVATLLPQQCGLT